MCLIEIYHNNILNNWVRTKHVRSFLIGIGQLHSLLRVWCSAICCEVNRLSGRVAQRPSGGRLPIILKFKHAQASFFSFTFSFFRWSEAFQVWRNLWKSISSFHGLLIFTGKNRMKLPPKNEKAKARWGAWERNGERGREWIQKSTQCERKEKDWKK